MRNLLKFAIIFALFFNGAAPAVSAIVNLSDEPNLKETLGDRIIICTGWGIKYIKLSDYIEGNFDEGENAPSSPISSNHCPLCLNPAIDETILKQGLYDYLEISFNEEVLFKLFSSSELLKDDFHDYLTSNDPPKIS